MNATDNNIAKLPPGYTPIAPGEELPAGPAGPFRAGSAGAIRNINPQEARELIGQAAVRYVAARLDGKSVARHTSLMLLGTWEPSLNPIPITSDGYLVDGLNRLMAIVISGTTQRMIIEHDPRPVAERGIGFHSGPRVRDMEHLRGQSVPDF
jgi:hypothetical protein